MVYTWTCPLCEPIYGQFHRITQLGIDTATAAHIMRHEEEASLRAVDNARLKCTDAACSLGKDRGLNRASGLFEPKLTDYDIKFMTGCKIKIG